MAKKKDPEHTFFVFSVFGRIFVFFNILAAVLFFLYLLGNFQAFLDDTQLFLLQNLQYIVLITGIFGGYYVAVLIIMSIKNKKAYLARYILTILSIVVNFTLFTSLKFMLSWFQL